MRVLHVIHIEAMGGAEKLLLQLLPALNEKVTTECLVINKKGIDKASSEIRVGLAAAGITVYSIEYTRLYSGAIRSGIKNIISNGRYDLLHSHLKYADTFIAWLKFNRSIRTPVVTTVHSFSDKYESRYGIVATRAIYKSAYYWVTRFLYKQFEGLVLISEVLKKFVDESHLADGKVKAVIPHGYTPVMTGEKSPHDSQEIKLAVPGRLLYRKGQHFAIDALQYIDIPGKKVTLHIYGDGPARPDLQKQIGDSNRESQVFLHGYVTNLVQRLMEADVVLVPSLWEGFGLVFLDAFTAVTPVVTFDLPAANEIILHEKNGLLATPGSSRSIAEQVTRLCVEPALGQRLVAQGAIDLVTRFSMDRMISSYVSLYEKVIC
ncbi:MAG: glycosyltransferase family 1 protein [Chitinophagaceae bacterium]|nr:MAG: glycosyltransferase family 1 protein [Chitinophagaceae bacterium]